MEHYLGYKFMCVAAKKHDRRFAAAQPAQILTTFASILTSIFIFLFFLRHDPNAWPKNPKSVAFYTKGHCSSS